MAPQLRDDFGTLMVAKQREPEYIAVVG